MMRQFGLCSLFQSVRRVREVNDAVLIDGEVVGTIEAPALKVRCERREAAVFFQPGDATPTVLAKDQSSLPVERESIGSLSALAAQTAAGFEHDGGCFFPFFPTENGVLRHV